MTETTKLASISTAQKHEAVRAKQYDMSPEDVAIM